MIIVAINARTRRNDEMAATTKRLDPTTLKARVLKMCDGTKTGAQIVAALGINPRQPIAHLHVLKKSHGITWKIEDGKILAICPPGASFESLTVRQSSFGD